jgi:flavin reductase (DIM6/NTAB) family NADH-FMN oxidoreductase RutF
MFESENALSQSVENARELAVVTDGISNDEYKAAMRRYPAGVTIVTLGSANGPVGFTATSFASLSMDPPLISFNIALNSSSLEALRAADSIVVHLLGEHQQHLSQRFSRSADQRFSDESLWSLLETGEPVLHGTPIWMRTTVEQLIPAGDHVLVIGRITRLHNENDDEAAAAPLLYHDGRYHRATPLD